MHARYHHAFASLAYADVFDYPLTKEELSLWLIKRRTIPQEFFRYVRVRGEFVTLTKREAIIPLRKKRRQYARAKWQFIRRVAPVFRLIPTVTLLGVTGGLSMDNVRQDDDIDLFFIVRPGTLWLTRLAVTILAEVLGIRRRPQDTSVADKVCMNMFMEEGALALPRGERDLFSAHEVLQMVPLWERGDSYRHMLMSNRWVADYLPNAWQKRTEDMPRSVKNAADIAWWGPLTVLEPIAKVAQLHYMQKRRTNEVIRQGMIRFHPSDARHWVREKLSSRFQHWHIPLDNFFYHR
jgi:hypothetical protein